MTLAFHPECMYELCLVLTTDVSPPHSPQQQLSHRKWHMHLTTRTEGPLVTLVQVSLKSVPPSLTVHCLASYQIFTYKQVGQYDQVRAGQHIADWHYCLCNRLKWNKRTLAMLWSWRPENWGLMLGRGRDFSPLHGVKLTAGAHPQSHVTCNRVSSPVSKLDKLLQTHVPICQCTLQHTPSNSLYIFRQQGSLLHF
jgi:hypothetical protein